MGVTIPVATIPAAVPFTTQAIRLTDAEIGVIGININVTLNEDGSGAITEGSYYPDFNTITDDNGNCVTIQQVLPVTDFSKSSSFAMIIACSVEIRGEFRNCLGRFNNFSCSFGLNRRRLMT